jgi:hypothetical protein
MENLREKNQTEIFEVKHPFSQVKNTVKSHSSKLEQVSRGQNLRAQRLHW